MNAITANFKSILKFAQDYGLPVSKKRAILREYLQTKIISLIYREKISKNLFFVGGTSLRFLRGLDRFSEDLDFDAVAITAGEINQLLTHISHRMEKENIKLAFYKQTGRLRSHHEFRFSDLLYELNLSPNRQEKLTVRFDFEFFWKGQKREVILANRYGFLTSVVTKSQDQVLVEKMIAYIRRRQTLGRDLYDVVWLAAQGAKPDWFFARKNKISGDIFDLALKKFYREKKSLPQLKARLKPFLFGEKNIDRLNFFPEVVMNFGRHN